MANKFVSWLQKAATDVEKAAAFTVQHILPVAGKLLVDASPIVSLVLPAEGPLVALVAQKITEAENKFPASGSGAQKLQWVTSEIEGELLPDLQKAGVDSATTNQVITNWINAWVTILDGPSTTAAPSTSTVAPATT